MCLLYNKPILHSFIKHTSCITLFAIQDAGLFGPNPIITITTSITIRIISITISSTNSNSNY